MVLLTEASAAKRILKTSGVSVLNSAFSGALGTSWCSCSSAKAGLSPRLRRIRQPTTMTTALSRNGTRQPHDSSAGSGSAAIGRNAAAARMFPPWVPARVKLVK
jgi:hypothetical protein